MSVLVLASMILSVRTLSSSATMFNVPATKLTVSVLCLFPLLSLPPRLEVPFLGQLGHFVSMALCDILAAPPAFGAALTTVMADVWTAFPDWMNATP